MAGLRIPNTPIVVDYWTIKEVPANSLFFLTHAHADHLNGLTSSWSRPIHCTPLTAKLVRLRRHVKQSLLVELEYDQPAIVFADGHGGRVPITVTPIDAHHCPGSAMFLFEGYFGIILHTGDFRLHPQLSQHDIMSGRKAVDVLYIDNTYCHPSCEFPSRMDAGDEVIKLVQDDVLDSEVFIGVPHVGREDLLVRIARSCHVWLSVSHDRMETLQVLQSPRVFTTDYEGTRVHVVLTNQITSQQVNKWISRHGKVTVIKPTCRHHGEGSLPFDAHPNIKLVKYSDHCSFNELLHFVHRVHPRCVKPSVSNCHGNMSYFNDLLDHTAMTTYNVPQPIKTMLTCVASCDPLGKRIRRAAPLLRKRRSLGVEFSDNSHVRSCDHHSLPQSNQSQSPVTDKENQPYPLPVNQLSKYDSTLEQPHPSSTIAMKPCPSSISKTERRYYKLVREHLITRNNQCNVSCDAWMLTCEYFNAMQPHPLTTTFDWSEFLLHEN